MNDSDSSWRRYAEVEPYFGVLTQRRFEKNSLTEASLQEFFHSGEEHIARVFATIRHRICPDFNPRRALDFGCGVARLVIPMAARSGQVVGIDVAPAMLEEAARNCRDRGVQNVSLVLADDTLSRLDGSFDLIHSFIVFQHIPVTRGMAIAGALLERLEIEGVAVLHFTYFAAVPHLNRVVAWLRNRFKPFHALVSVARGFPMSRPVIQMNSYNLNSLVHLFQTMNCHILHVDFTDHGGYLGAVFFVQKKAENIVQT